MNILFVGAHHDDLEISIGGSVRRWVEDGHNVFGVTLTDSTWSAPDGTRFREKKEQVKLFCKNASGTSGLRKPDGTLPDLPFLTLANSSDMIDAGMDVGDKFSGAAPDIGAHEFDSAPAPNPACLGHRRVAC